MNKHCIRLSAILFVSFLGILTPQFAQDAPVGPTEADKARRMIAVSLLRTINTAEVTYHSKNGSFVIWQTLLLDQPKHFDKFLAMHGLQQANVRFGDTPEILPGWDLRLNVHADGLGYDVLLGDKTDKKCGYAALTNESGVIRQSKALDCEI